MSREPEDHSWKRLISRRKLLAILGMTGMSLSVGASLLFDSRKKTADTQGGTMDYTLQELKQASYLSEGQVVTTYGYYRVGDGGGGSYHVKRSADRDDGGSVIHLQNGLQAHLLPDAGLNYRLFGAVGDGVNDDGVQMKKAHSYANKTGVPIVNLSGEYWIKNTQQITIQTHVQWGQTKFHIDEGFNKTEAPKFQVTSSKEAVQISLDQTQKASLLSKLKPGVTLISELAPYKNCLVVVKDEKDRIGIRYGYENNTGWAKTEFFYVEEHGRIIGDIAWTFKDFTNVTAYPCDDSYLTIDGGTFYVSGNDPGIDPKKYVQNGFVVRRSRTRICNQWVGLEPGKTDTSLNARTGFYTFNFVYDVLLENVRLIPWEYHRADPKRVLLNGTYGLGGSTVMNATFRNVTAEGSDIHWGVFGTNLFKNFRVEGCRLNRVDVHFHCWNLYLRDSEIGSKGFTLTGGGDLFIENTRCVGNNFIAMRNDYGAKWDGDIRIRNCRLVVTNGQQEACALRFGPSDFDYKYPIGYGRTIRVEDFTFDYSGIPASQGACWIMRIAPFSQTKTGQRLFFPTELEFRNIGVQGRENGVRIMEIKDASGFELRKKGGFDGELFTSNCLMRFDNIQLEPLPEQTSQSTKHVHFLLKNAKAETDGGEHSLYPRIEFANCGPFFGHFPGATADVSFSQCLINCIDAYEAGAMRGRLAFDRCDFKAIVADDGKNFSSLEASLGTYLTNCTIHTPVVGGAARPDLVDRYAMLAFNESVKYNHMNTKVAKTIVDEYAGRGIAVKPEFADMLRSHSDSVWR